MFGEQKEDYGYNVLNEREVRASAGLMFLFGILSFFHFIITKNLLYAELFSITFIIEFIVRMFINPIYAPYMIIGKLIVSNQSPEWVEAKPKRFAWWFGLGLGLIMSYFIIFDIVTPLRGLTCILCLFLLFLESSFGICLGCLLYKKLNKPIENCAGGQCEVTNHKLYDKQKSMLVLTTFVFIVLYILVRDKHNPDNKYSLFYVEPEKIVKEENILEKKQQENPFKDVMSKENLHNPTKVNNGFQDLNNNKLKDCNPPQWAIDIGHETMWKEHNCK